MRVETVLNHIEHYKGFVYEACEGCDFISLHRTRETVDGRSRKAYNVRILKISTKGRYGLRTLVEIAMHHGAGAVTLNELSRRQDISVKYLWQVINPLKAAGILGVARGARGGYFLIRRPEDLTMLEIVTALEGELQVSDCLNKKRPCPKSGTCVARAVWQEVNNAVKDTLQKITLAELIRRCAASATPDNYVI